MKAITDRATADGREPPLWYVIVDDDTYLLGPAVVHVLRPFTTAIEQDPQTRIFAGHTVVRCKNCRTKSKRFSFAFGGNGIFLSKGVVDDLAPRVADCSAQFFGLPGDEQVGGCIAKFRIANLQHLSVGTETMFMAFGDKAEEVLPESPFPYSFHRIIRPQWAIHLRELENRFSGQILRWKEIFDFFLVEHASEYHTVRLIFQETENTTQVVKYLRERGIH